MRFDESIKWLLIRRVTAGWIPAKAADYFMCGIFGWITPSRPVPRARGAVATNLMRHRGPDDEGYLLCSWARREAALAAGEETSPALRLRHLEDSALVPEADVLLGFRRLSIHDLSEAGHQPMGTPDGKLWIIFNGEVYNFRELREELELTGIKFSSGTDTEVILRAYEAWGAACLQRFNGMWGMAILDFRQDGVPKLMLARDRCGVKPLYFAEDGQGGLVFASELKPVLATRDRWTPDPIQISNFIAWARYPSPGAGDTFYQEIRSLPPGCLARLTPSGLKIERWWELPENGSGDASGTEETVEKLRGLLEDAVRLRLRADVPVGSCLSGGVDSSIIVGMVNRLLAQDAGATNSGGTQHTFSAVYEMEGPFNERKFVDRVLSGINAKGHYTIPRGEDLVTDFDQMVRHQEEPLTTTSVFAQWSVMKLVKQSGTTVLLDGQAADELFAGYRPYSWFLSSTIRKKGLMAAFREMRYIKSATGDSALKNLIASVPVACLPEAMVTAAIKMGYRRALRRESIKLLPRQSANSLIEHVCDARTPESYPWRRVTENLDTHLRQLLVDFGLPHLLRFEDKNSMAFSIEARVPFTDYRLVEFAFSPAMKDLKIHKGWAKWVLRRAGHGVVPEDILWRRDKMGFGTPEAHLVQVLAKASGARYLDAAISSGMVNGDGARKVIEAAKNGSTDKQEYLQAFRVMAAASWHSQFGSRKAFS